MYYERKILPLDTNGNFLFAIHFRQYKVGGECSRESEHASFAFGNIDAVDDLTDITALCCLDRKPNKLEAAEHRHTAEVQRDFVGDEKRAWKSSYQAEMAEKAARFVPRVVLASTTGILVVAMSCEEGPDSFYAIQKVIDVFDQRILKEYKDAAWPRARSIESPAALARDGKSIIYCHYTETTGEFRRRGITDKAAEASYPGVDYGAHFVALADGWISIDENTTRRFQYGETTPISEWKTPRQIFPWSAKPGLESDILALSGDKGLIVILDTSTGKTRKFFPHRGCKRDDFAKVALSADGQWMVSKLYNKNELVATRLGDGKSWPIGQIEDQVIVEREEGRYRSESFIPAEFAFIGTRLLVSDSFAVRELSYEQPENPDRVFVSEQGKPGARVPLKIPRGASLGKIIETASLDKHKAEIEDLHYPALKLISKKPKNSGWKMPDKRGAPVLGESRFGGWPDMPAGTAWPMWDGRPMGFLAQINLSEASAVQPELRLPGEGLLLFFLGCGEETFENDEHGRETYLLDILLGSKPGHGDGWRVIYAKPGEKMNRTVYEGTIAPELIEPSLIRMTKGGMPLPSESTAAYDRLDLNQTERDNFNEVIDLTIDEYPENQLAGYPYLIQSTPPEVFCALAVSGRDPFDFPEEGSDDYRQIQEQAVDWGLLLQLTSDDNPGFLWGDGGHLYFLGDRKEMEAGNFDTTWVFYEN